MAANCRQHTKEFKLQVVREVEAGKSIAQASREHKVHPTLITRWRAALQKHPESAISGNGNTLYLRGPHRRARAPHRPAHGRELRPKKGLVQARGAGPIPDREWEAMMVSLIVEHAGSAPVSRLYDALGLSRSQYYRCRLGAPELDADLELRDLIQRVALEWPTYGNRRVTHELRRRGVEANHKRVLRLMRQDNLLCLRRKRFVVTTNSDHGLPYYPNLVPELEVRGIDQLWVADITYVRLLSEFIHLAVVLDAFGRRCVGWAVGRTLGAELAVTALETALGTRSAGPGLVHHSDRGVQYASTAYTKLLKERGVRISMSRRVNRSTTRRRSGSCGR